MFLQRPIPIQSRRLRETPSRVRSRVFRAIEHDDGQDELQFYYLMVDAQTLNDPATPDAQSRGRLDIDDLAIYPGSWLFGLSEAPILPGMRPEVLVVDALSDTPTAPGVQVALSNDGVNFGGWRALAHTGSLTVSLDETGEDATRMVFPMLSVPGATEARRVRWRVQPDADDPTPMVARLGSGPDGPRQHRLFRSATTPTLRLG